MVPFLILILLRNSFYKLLDLRMLEKPSRSQNNPSKIRCFFNYEPPGGRWELILILILPSLKIMITIVSSKI
jgi:hypothetical protein